jgi:uncharacterized protein YdbL (DUF1318 family)
MKALKLIKVLSLALALALPAFAQTEESPLHKARAMGTIGERADGYVAVVSAHPSSDVKALVDEVNAKRRAHYEEVAKRNGAPVEAVAAIAGQKLIASAASGEFVDDGTGWKKKP